MEIKQDSDEKKSDEINEEDEEPQVIENEIEYVGPRFSLVK